MEMQIIMNKPVSEIVKVVHQFANYTHVFVEKTIPIVGKNEVYSFLQHDVPDFSRKLLEVRQFGRNHKYIFENDSWALYRFSGTEPMLRLFVEAENIKETKRLTKLMMDFVDIKDSYERKNLKVVSAN
jgi:phosphomannomutase